MIAGAAALLMAFAVSASTQAIQPSTRAQSFEQVARAAQQARDENRDDDAIRLFQQGLELKPEWNEGLWYLGTLLYEKERFGEARDLLRQFVIQSPKFGTSSTLNATSRRNPFSITAARPSRISRNSLHA